MEVRAAEGNSGPAADYALALALVVVAVGLAVTGVILLVTCETTQFSNYFGNVVVGCSYPFQWYGGVFLYAASLVVALEAFPIRRVLLAKGRGHDWNPVVVSGVTAVFETLAFVLLYFLV